MGKEYRALLVVEDVPGSPALECIAILPGRVGGVDDVRADHATSFDETGVVVGRDEPHEGKPEQRGVDGCEMVPIRAGTWSENLVDELSEGLVAERPLDGLGGRLGS